MSSLPLLVNNLVRCTGWCRVILQIIPLPFQSAPQWWWGCCVAVITWMAQNLPLRWRRLIHSCLAVYSLSDTLWPSFSGLAGVCSLSLLASRRSVSIPWFLFLVGYTCIQEHFALHIYMYDLTAGHCYLHLAHEHCFGMGEINLD